MTALHKALRMERVVIVTPSIYGPDNSATLFGMKARGATARGVAVIDDKTSEADLDAMNQAGIRGIRLNLATGGTSDPNVGRARLQAGIERVKAVPDRRWPPAHPAPRMGAGCRSSQEDPGRQSGEALRVLVGLQDGCLMPPLPLWERVWTAAAGISRQASMI